MWEQWHLKPGMPELARRRCFIKIHFVVSLTASCWSLRWTHTGWREHIAGFLGRDLAKQHSKSLQVKLTLCWREISSLCRTLLFLFLKESTFEKNLSYILIVHQFSHYYVNMNKSLPKLDTQVSKHQTEMPQRDKYFKLLNRQIMKNEKLELFPPIELYLISAESPMLMNKKCRCY